MSTGDNFRTASTCPQLGTKHGVLRQRSIVKYECSVFTSITVAPARRRVISGGGAGSQGDQGGAGLSQAIGGRYANELRR